MNDIIQLLASLDGARIPGGCDHCDAFAFYTLASAIRKAVGREWGPDLEPEGNAP
jgi:hypothetical protein